MLQSIIRGLLAALLTAAAALPAAGQHAMTQDGRLFDANPQIGTRYNDARAVAPNLPGNYTATGNARFGQSLRSFSPISDPTEFRAALGSATLSNFRRDSVVVADRWSGLGGGYGTGGYYGGGYSGALPGFGRTQPFYDPSRTVGMPTVLQAQPNPGTPLATGLQPPPAPNTLDRGVGMIGGLRTQPLNQPLDWRVNTSVDAAVATGQPSYRWQGSSSLFGMRPPTLPSPVARRETELANSSAIDPRASLPQAIRPATSLRPLDANRPAGAMPLDTAADLARTGRNPQVVDTGQNRLTPADLQPGLVRPPTTAAPQAQALPDSAARPRLNDPSLFPGYDLFTDMRLALALQRDPGAAWFRDMQSAVRDNAAVGVQQLEVAQLRSEEFVDRLLSGPIRSFVGPGASELNNEMLKAESLMSIGQYYDAAGRYETARLADPNNPLPAMGKAHALLAAGEYLSAAVALLAGVERFPEIARFQLDLKALLGGGEIVDIRRADIMDRLKDSEDPRLRFLLGYLEFFGGYRESGLANLDRAAQGAPPGSILADFPRLLRGEIRAPLPRGLQSGPATVPSIPAAAISQPRAPEATAAPVRPTVVPQPRVVEQPRPARPRIDVPPALPQRDGPPATPLGRPAPPQVPASSGQPQTPASGGQPQSHSGAVQPLDLRTAAQVDDFPLTRTALGGEPAADAGRVALEIEPPRPLPALPFEDGTPRAGQAMPGSAVLAEPLPVESPTARTPEVENSAYQPAMAAPPPRRFDGLTSPVEQAAPPASAQGADGTLQRVPVGTIVLPRPAERTVGEPRAAGERRLPYRLPYDPETGPGAVLVPPPPAGGAAAAGSAPGTGLPQQQHQQRGAAQSAAGEAAPLSFPPRPATRPATQPATQRPTPSGDPDLDIPPPRPASSN